MNIKRILHITGIALGGLVAVTVIYAAIENRITNIANQESLTKYLQDNKFAVIEFYNPTCPVCNAFKKKGIFPALASKLPHIGFAMISFEEAKPLHEAFDIKAFPTFIFFKDGKELSRYEGYVELVPFMEKIQSDFAHATPMEQ